MKGRRSGMGAELVPLALILACVVGSLALVVAVQRPKARRPPAKLAVAVAPSPPPAKAAPATASPKLEVAEVEEPEPPAAPAPIDPTPAALAKLTSAEAEQLLEASRADRKSAALEEARKSALAESERWRRREALVHAQLDSLDGKVRKMEGEVDALALERDALERERDSRKALAARARSRPGQAILPHRGPNGTWRRPIVVECTNGMAILQPRGLGFGLLDLAMGFGPSSNPFVATVAREAIRIQGEASPDGQAVVPYIFFIVRPDGIRPYYEARGRLEPLGITFGYELADQDWDIDFPDLDDTSTWDGSAPRMGTAKAADRGSDEDALDRVLHPKAGRAAPRPKAVAAEDQEFPSFASPGRGRSPATPDGNGFAWPSTPAPRYIAEAGIVGPDAVRGAGQGQPRQPAGDSPDPAASTPGVATAKAPNPGGAARKPLDRQGRARIARADGASTSAGSGKDPTDFILAGGPPGGLMPVPPASGDEPGSGRLGRTGGIADTPGRAGRPPTQPTPARREGFHTASGGAGGGADAPSDGQAGPGQPGRTWGDLGASGGAKRPPTQPSPARGEGFPTALGAADASEGLNAARAVRGGGLDPAPSVTTGDGFELSPPPTQGQGPSPRPLDQAGGGSPPAPSPLMGGGTPDEGPVADRPKAGDDPGSSFVWPKAPQGSDKRKAPAPSGPLSAEFDKLAAAEAGSDQLPPATSSPIVEDLGQVGSPSASPPGDPASAGGGTGTASRANQAGRPAGVKSSKDPGSSANPDRSGSAGAGGSDPARRMLGQSSSSASSSGSPPPPQGLAGLGLGLPNGMTPPQGNPGDPPPTPPAASPRSRPSAMPELPPGKIHDRTFEVVVVCNARGVIVQPGGYRVTSGALKDRDGLFKKQIVGLVKGKRMSEPDVIVEPKVRFLVQAGGYETYRTARSQFLLSGLDWPATTQVADPDPLGILPSEGW